MKSVQSVLDSALKKGIDVLICKNAYTPKDNTLIERNAQYTIACCTRGMYGGIGCSWYGIYPHNKRIYLSDGYWDYNKCRDVVNKLFFECDISSFDFDGYYSNVNPELSFW